MKQRYEAQIQESNQLKSHLLEAEGLIVSQKNNIQGILERTIFFVLKLRLGRKEGGLFRT
jgi:hypothetical protein